MLERYELAVLIDTLDYIETTIARADDREHGLTHAQKHFVIQTALIVIRDLKAGYEQQGREMESPTRMDGIPF